MKWGRAVVALALVGGCSSVDEEAPQRLSWTSCSASVECATLTVPASWHEPDGPTTSVTLVRLPASGRRLGSVVVNLGSGNGTNAMLGQVPPALRELARDFDVVVFDAPGLAGSVIECVPAPSVYGLVRDQTPAGWAAQASANAAYDASCRSAAGPVYSHLTSWQVANDLDALRAALGEEKLRYVGNSYGTAYGQAYAEAFGSRVERMYLDGVADHTSPELLTWLSDHARTQEEQLGRFLSWCAGMPSCSLSHVDAAVARDPVGVLIGLNPPRWPDLAAALDGGEFPAELPPEPFGSVQPALLCHDFLPDVPSYEEFLEIEERLRAVAPRVGWLSGRMQVGRCVGMSGGPAYPPAPLVARGLPPVLVGIGELDNNTPHLGARRVVSQLPGARAVTHGDGHAAYLLGNRCLGAHVQAYFTAGTLPPAGTRCAAELLPGSR